MNISTSIFNFSNVGSIQEAPVPKAAEALPNPAFNAMSAATQSVFASKGAETNDLSGVIDISLKVIQNSSTFVNFPLQIIEFICLFSGCVYMTPLMRMGYVTTRLIVATIEFVLETRGIFRTGRFIYPLRNNQETLGTLETLRAGRLETLRALKRDYFELSKEEQQEVNKTAEKLNQKGTLQEKNHLIERLTKERLEGKQEQLMRCIQVKFALRVVRELNSLIENLEIENLEQGHKNWEEAIEVNALGKANAFLYQTIVQAKKTDMMHFLGMLGNGLIVAGLVASYFGPGVAPLICFLFSLGMAFLRYDLQLELALFECVTGETSCGLGIHKMLVDLVEKQVQSVDKTIRNLWEKTKPHRDLCFKAVKQTMIPFKAFCVEFIKNWEEAIAVQSVDKTIRNLWEKTKPHRDLCFKAVKQTMIPFSTFKAFCVEFIKNWEEAIEKEISAANAVCPGGGGGGGG